MQLGGRTANGGSNNKVTNLVVAVDVVATEDIMGAGGRHKQGSHAPTIATTLSARPPIRLLLRQPRRVSSAAP